MQTSVALIFVNTPQTIHNRTFMLTATDIVWETYPQCPINNTLVVRDALTALTNVSVVILDCPYICVFLHVASYSSQLYNPTNHS